MRTFRIMALGLSLASPLAFVGCGEEASVEKKTVIKSPGGESVVTDKQTVKSTGDNPPIDVKENPAP